MPQLRQILQSFMIPGDRTTGYIKEVTNFQY